MSFGIFLVVEHDCGIISSTASGFPWKLNNIQLIKRRKKHFKMTELETVSSTVLRHPSHYLQFSVQFGFTCNVWTRDFQITAASPMITVAKFLVNARSIYPSPLLYAAIRNGGSSSFGDRSGLLWKAQSSRPRLLSFCAIRVRTKTTTDTTALLTASKALSR